MKRIKLFEEHSTKGNPRFTEKEIYDAIKYSDFDQFFSVDIKKVKIGSWRQSFESDYQSSDPEYVKSEFKFYIDEYGVQCDINGLKEELEKSLLKIKTESPDDEDLLKDLGEVGFTEKYFSLERILGSINNEKDLEGQTSPKERDYIIESMIDDPKSNPVQVWSTAKEYVGKIELDKLEFSDYLLDRLERKIS